MLTFALVRRLKIIFILLLIGFVSKANIPGIVYFGNNNLQTTFSKLDSKQTNNVDFLYEESEVEEEEEHQKDDNREKNCTYKLYTSSTFSLINNATIHIQCIGTIRYIVSKKITCNSLYISFANFRI